MAQKEENLLNLKKLIDSKKKDLEKKKEGATQKEEIINKYK